MLMLILETSSEKGCLILAENGTPVQMVSLGGGPELSKTAAAKCKAALHKTAPNGTSEVLKVDVVAIGTGPGSYTGIRVGVALAKALSYGWRVPLMGFCSLQAFGPPPILVDAKSGGFYALFDEKPLLIAPSDPRLQNISGIRSPHPEIIQKRLCLSSRFEETGPSPEHLAPFLYRKFLEEGAAPFELTYLSPP